MAKKFTLCESTRVALEDFAKRARTDLLLKPMKCIKFPCGSNSDCWDHKKIGEINKQIFRELDGMGNIYCIFTKYKGGDWIAQYVGQRKSNGLKQRIRSHLVFKSKKTGSQLKKVQYAVGKRGQVGISYILIEPEALRSYVEEFILSTREYCQLRWNKNV